MKVLFVYNHKYPNLWRDGLWAALRLLEKDGFEIFRMNLSEPCNEKAEHYDFVLGWGAFNSAVDKALQTQIKFRGNNKFKVGLCIAGNSFPPEGQDNYDVLFYETEWFLPQIVNHPNAVHAFGVNTDIYKPMEDAVPIWDWTTVGAFAYWKRQSKILDKGGYRLAIGEIQKENMNESADIFGPLLMDGVAVSDMVEPEVLATIYNASAHVYIPADINGGGERAVLEARACGRPVSIEADNPKLKELLTWKERGRVPDHHWYADQLKKGVLSCL